MKHSEVKDIFKAIAVANGHPSPDAYADRALEAWKNPTAPEVVTNEPKEGE